MHLKHRAAGFLAGFGGKLRENIGNFGFFSDFRHPRNCQNYHRLSLSYFEATFTGEEAALEVVSSSSRNSSTKIVSSRPGPVDTMPMRAPLSFSMKDR